MTKEYCYSEEICFYGNGKKTGIKKPREEILVYIAGPYRGDVEKNVKMAEWYASIIAMLGVGFICPHSNGYPHESLGLSSEYWLNMTLEIMRRCDAVFMVDGWEHSEGAIAEKIEAEQLGIPVIETAEEFQIWIENATKNGEN